MSYSKQDHQDIKENLRNYPKMNYLSERVANIQERHPFWLPTILIGESGFAQFEIKNEIAPVSAQASSQLWQQLRQFNAALPDSMDWMISIDSLDQWMLVNVEVGANVIDALSLYEDFCEFVAVDKAQRYVIAAYTENISSYRDELQLYCLLIEKADEKMSFYDTTNRLVYP
ncbi:hypothetical protein [Celerinatantimonas sp. MCCC 1A17872]|uniref:hypothetical protein n=1 Tax=Celerinatantimonas sp. MCCC 1A17872 TaxID=3177514 RepID=UPI0038BECDB9